MTEKRTRKSNYSRISRVTADHIRLVRKCMAKFPNATNNEIGMFCGIGKSTVECIKSGKYDYLLDGSSEPDCALYDESMTVCPFNSFEECTDNCAMYIKEKDRCLIAGAAIAHMKILKKLSVK